MIFLFLLLNAALNAPTSFETRGADVNEAGGEEIEAMNLRYLGRVHNLSAPQRSAYNNNTSHVRLIVSHAGYMTLPHDIFNLRLF